MLSFADLSKLEVRVLQQPHDRERAWHRRPGDAPGQRRQCDRTKSSPNVACWGKAGLRSRPIWRAPGPPRVLRPHSLQWRERDRGEKDALLVHQERQDLGREGGPFLVLRQPLALRGAMSEIIIGPDEDHRIEHAGFLGPACVASSSRPPTVLHSTRPPAFPAPVTSRVG